MLAVLWFDNFVTLLTTIPGKWWEHEQNLWMGSRKKSVWRSCLLHVFPPRNSQFPLKMSPSRLWDPALWSLRFGARWLERTKHFSKGIYGLIPIWLFFCACCTSLVERSGFEEQLSVAVAVVLELESIRQINDKSLRRNTFYGLYIIYVAIKYPITFNHAGAIWRIPFSLPNIWRGDYMCNAHCAYRIHTLVLNI